MVAPLIADLAGTPTYGVKKITKLGENGNIICITFNFIHQKQIVQNSYTFHSYKEKKKVNA